MSEQYASFCPCCGSAEHRAMSRCTFVTGYRRTQRKQVTNSARQIVAPQYQWWSGSYGQIFPSSDCSGAPIIVANIFGVLRPSTVIRRGATA
jgi:hypothetical protein